MRKSLLALAILVGFGSGTAMADKMDWSSYLEPPGSKAKVVSKPVEMSKIAKMDKPAKAAKVAKVAKAPKKPVAKKAAKAARAKRR